MAAALLGDESSRGQGPQGAGAGEYPPNAPSADAELDKAML